MATPNQQPQRPQAPPTPPASLLPTPPASPHQPPYPLHFPPDLYPATPPPGSFDGELAHEEELEMELPGSSLEGLDVLPGEGGPALEGLERDVLEVELGGWGEEWRWVEQVGEDEEGGKKEDGGEGNGGSA